MNHILECEFYLLELMDCCLIVYHPYRPLLQYVQDMGQEDVLLPLAWRIVNDTYRTDLCLLYPPFMIALACLHVACVVQQKDARQWFAELSVDMEKILEIIRVILKLYEQWKNFDERKEMATILSKMPKPKPPPNRYISHLAADLILLYNDYQIFFRLWYILPFSKSYTKVALFLFNFCLDKLLMSQF
ncbi:cyclin-C isoform X3 [Rattus norvegicus]